MQSNNTSGHHPGARDITTLKTEMNPEEQLALLAAIVESSGDAIISKTLEGIITSWNHSAQRLFGYTADEVIGLPVSILIPPERMQEETEILDKLGRGERVEHFETQRMAKDKKIMDISLTISPIKNREGVVIGASKIARDITEQKRVERLIRESEDRLRMAIESTQLGAWEFYPLTGKLTWSEECRRIYDAPTDQEITYDFFLTHIHPEDREFAETAIREAMDPAGDGNYDIQYRILRYSDQQTRWIRAKGKVFFDQIQPERFIGTVLDITDEKNQELKLKDSVELFTIMANNVPAMIWMSGNDKFKDYFNHTWLEFTGRSIEEEQDEGWLDNVYPEDRPGCVTRYNQAYSEQIGFYSEYRLRRFDGEYRWVADNSVPRFDTNGEFAGYISACIDIDDQKRFSEKIRESELMLKTISNASPVGLWMTDTEGNNTFVNETWIEWTGIPLEEQLLTGWLGSLVEEDREIAPAKFREAMEKKEKYTCEFRILRPDGDTRWCLTEGSPYYDINGNFAGYAGSVTDITEMKRMEQRKDDFIRMASHELKTPITSIKGYVQLLMNIYNEWNEEKLKESTATVRSSLHTISRQVSKLTRLVSELLDLSRIESGKLELFKTHFDLDAMVEETIQDVRHTTSRHALIIHHNGGGTVFGDKERLGQVLVNLLTNAIKYSPDADRIDVTVDGTDTKVIIQIKDYGIGIDKKDHHRIFERFYRVEGKSEQTYPGFGIGLFIAGEIVQRHQGELRVESEKGKGSIFTVILPRLLKPGIPK